MVTIRRLMATRDCQSDETQDQTQAALTVLSLQIGGGAVDFIAKLNAKDPQEWAKAREQESSRTFLFLLSRLLFPKPYTLNRLNYQY